MNNLVPGLLEGVNLQELGQMSHLGLTLLDLYNLLQNLMRGGIKTIERRIDLGGEMTEQMILDL